MVVSIVDAVVCSVDVGKIEVTEVVVSASSESKDCVKLECAIVDVDKESIKLVISSFEVDIAALVSEERNSESILSEDVVGINKDVESISVESDNTHKVDLGTESRVSDDMSEEVAVGISTEFDDFEENDDTSKVVVGDATVVVGSNETSTDVGKSDGDK